MRIGCGKFRESRSGFDKLLRGPEGISQTQGGILFDGGSLGAGGKFRQLGDAFREFLFRDQGCGVEELGLFGAFVRNLAFAGLHIGQK